MKKNKEGYCLLCPTTPQHITCHTWTNTVHIHSRKRAGFLFVGLQLHFSVLTFSAACPFAGKMKTQFTSVEITPNSSVDFVMLCYDWTVTVQWRS